MNTLQKITSAAALVSALVFTGAAIAAPGMGPGPNPQYAANGYACPYYDGRHHKGHRGMGYGMGDYYLQELAMQYPEYAQDVKNILDLQDSVATQRRVVRALEQAAEPDIKDITKQSNILNSLQRQLQGAHMTLRAKLVEANLLPQAPIGVGPAPGFGPGPGPKGVGPALGFGPGPQAPLPR